MDRLEKALQKARAERLANAANMPPDSGFYSALSGNVSTSLHMAPVAPAANLAPAEEANLERHRVLAHRMKSEEADVFRILRTQVLQVMNKSGFRTLAITSPNYGDGKTTISLNLGVSIALDLKQTVLMVDLDLRKPNLYEFLGLDPTIGLSNYLLHGTPLKDCMVRPPFERLNTLPAGPALYNSSEVLGSPKMAALARELKTRYPDRLIIYDMPPVLAQDDSIAFMPHVDAVLLVVRDGVTRAHEIKHCLNALSNANVIGTVLNDARLR